MQLPACDYLDDLGVAYEKREFPADTEKGAANVARAMGFEERQMVKTLIFESGEGERVLVLVGGDQSAISGHLKVAIGNRATRAPGRAARLRDEPVPPHCWRGAWCR